MNENTLQLETKRIAAREGLNLAAAERVARAVFATTPRAFRDRDPRAEARTIAAREGLDLAAAERVALALRTTRSGGGDLPPKAERSPRSLPKSAEILILAREVSKREGIELHIAIRIVSAVATALTTTRGT